MTWRIALAIVLFILSAFTFGAVFGRRVERKRWREVARRQRHVFNELAAIVEQSEDASAGPWALHDTLGNGFDIRGPDREPMRPHDGAFYITEGDDGGGAFSNPADALLCVMMRNAIDRLLSLLTGVMVPAWNFDTIAEIRRRYEIDAEIPPRAGMTIADDGWQTTNIDPRWTNAQKVDDADDGDEYVISRPSESADDDVTITRDEFVRPHVPLKDILNNPSLDPEYAARLRAEYDETKPNWSRPKVKHDGRPWRDYPLGTRAYDETGAYWTRTVAGWQANGGDSFPTPAASALLVWIPKHVAREVLDATLEVVDVTCTKCGYEQNDFGPNTRCPECGATMPTRENDVVRPSLGGLLPDDDNTGDSDRT